MKLFSLLSLALFCIDTATPAPVNTDGSLGFRPVGAKPAAIMSTVERRAAPKMKAAIMTPIERRALPKIKLPKSDAEKIADAKKVLTSGGKEAADTAADTAKKAARDARKAEKKAAKGKKEQKVEETKKDLTEDDKKGVQEELEVSKQQKKKEKEEEKTDDDVEIKVVTRKEYNAFWKEFSTNPRPKPADVVGNTRTLRSGRTIANTLYRRRERSRAIEAETTVDTSPSSVSRRNLKPA